MWQSMFALLTANRHRERRVSATLYDLLADRDRPRTRRKVTVLGDRAGIVNSRNHACLVAEVQIGTPFLLAKRHRYHDARACPSDVAADRYGKFNCVHAGAGVTLVSGLP